MSLRFLLILSGGLEALMGVLMMLVPNVAVTALLGASVDTVGTALARLLGAGIFSLGLASLKARDDLRNAAGMAVSLGITSYNVLAAVVLVWVAMVLHFGGPLLWVAGIGHVALGILFVHALISCAKKPGAHSNHGPRQQGRQS